MSSRPTERDQQPSSANGPRTISIPQILFHSGTNIRKATTSSSLTMWSVPLPAAMETYECASMAFGPSPIRFLRRPSEAPLLSAGPEKAVECWSELGASFPLIFRPSDGVGVILKLHRLEKATQLPVCFATTLATTFGRFGPSRNRLNTGDSFKPKTGVDNKRHTNAHQPLTSHSPTGVSIPPSPPSFQNTNKLATRLRMSTLLVQVQIPNARAFV